MDTHRRLAAPVIPVLIAGGLQLSGYTNPVLAAGLLVLAIVLASFAAWPYLAFYWKRRARVQSGAVGFRSGLNSLSAYKAHYGRLSLPPPINDEKLAKGLEGMEPTELDDFDLIPVGFHIRGTKTRDGFDIAPRIQIRNRSPCTVDIKSIYAKFILEQKSSGKGGGLSKPWPKESPQTVRFTPIRTYTDSLPINGIAAYALKFGNKQESAILLYYSFEILSLPKSDKSEELEIRSSEMTRYFVSKS